MIKTGRVMKYNLNTSNLHVGGGIQVAVSVIAELARLDDFPPNFSILASTEVDTNLCKAGDVPGEQAAYDVVDSHGLRQLLPSQARRFQGFVSVFTVFGPLYIWRAPFRNIVGFAQPWIIYPNNECYGMLSLVQRLKLRLKYWVQGHFFKRADVLVVDLEHVKQGLIRELGIPPERIHVIHSCISSVYLDESVWQQVDMPHTDGYLRLGFLGRNYLHKNTAIFPGIVRELERSHGILARFFVTFTEEEWDDCAPEFRAVCINVGPLDVVQCPRFYESLDAVVFPSLLETFSATPFETLVMKKPLFASDRNFNRDICDSHAHYFDPLSPSDAAQAIANVFVENGPDLKALQVAREHAIHFSSPEERAEKYLALLMADKTAA